MNHGMRGRLRRVLFGRGNSLDARPRSLHFVLHSFNDWLEGEETLLEIRRKQYAATYGASSGEVVQQ